MKIDANDKEIRDILKLGYFKIPRFQRPYSWGTDEVSKFWNDVVEEDREDYFIGSMVVYQINKPYFGIVDGQQRLTTITLILAAIRNAFLQLDEENLARGVHNFIELPNINNEPEFILNSETSFPFLHDHIQGYDGASIQCSVGTEEKSLKYAFDLVNQKLSEKIPNLEFPETGQLNLFKNDESIKILKNIRDKIVSLKIVFIELDNERDAHQIFETLNARGKNLNTSDLVKNHLLNQIQSGNASLDVAKETWNRILSRFDDAGLQDSMDPFLYHYWLSKHEYTSNPKLFEKITASSQDLKTAQALLKDLQENSEYYLSIAAPESYPWSNEEEKIKDSLVALSSFKVKQQHPMTLALIRAYRKKHLTLKMLKQSLEKIEFFHFAFNGVTSQRSSGSISTQYSKYAIALTQAANDHSQIQKNLKSLNQGLKNKLPNFNEFLASFQELTFTSRKTKDKKLIRYILTKMMGDTVSGLPINKAITSLEHLISQEQITNQANEKIIGNIGNLIIVDRATNSEDLKNLPFLKKLEILKNKGYPIDDYLKGQTEWGEEHIKERAKSLANHFYFSMNKL